MMTTFDLGEIPTYQAKEHNDAIQNDVRKIGKVLENKTVEVFFYIILSCSTKTETEI